MTDPKEKLANILHEIKVQRAAIEQKLSGVKVRRYMDAVNACMRKFRQLPYLEMKARELEHKIRGSQQPG